MSKDGKEIITAEIIYHKNIMFDEPTIGILVDDYLYCIAVNGNIYFGAMYENGIGGNGIYISCKLLDGSWRIAQDLGEGINTLYSESRSAFLQMVSSSSSAAHELRPR